MIFLASYIRFQTDHVLQSNQRRTRASEPASPHYHLDRIPQAADDHKEHNISENEARNELHNSVGRKCDTQKTAKHLQRIPPTETCPFEEGLLSDLR